MTTSASRAFSGGFEDMAILELFERGPRVSGVGEKDHRTEASAPDSKPPRLAAGVR